MVFMLTERSWWGILPLRCDSPFYAPLGSSVAETETDGAFVNAGTHQIPLFEGIPPLEVTNSYSPYETLLTLLRKNQPTDSVGCFCPTAFDVMCSNLGEVVPQPSEFEPPVLARSGASAIIRMVDAKMVRFCSNHIKVDNQMPDSTLLKEIIRAEGGGGLRTKLFEYNPLKYELYPSVYSSMLKSLQQDVELLTDAINAKSESDVLEYLYSLN